MADWKIIVTLLVVLGVLAVFVGSAPVVSDFFSEVGGKFAGLFPGDAADASQNGDNEFSLVLYDSGEVVFRSAGSNVIINQSSDAVLDKGSVKFYSASLSGFAGSGSVSLDSTLRSPAFMVLQLNGSADVLQSESSRFEKSKIFISTNEVSSSDYFSAGNVSIESLAQDNARGELILNGSITKFSGRLEMKSVSGKMFFSNGALQIEGKAKSMSVPGAGIKIG